MGVKFAGSASYLHRSANLPTPSAFTVCLWFRAPSSVGAYQTLISLEADYPNYMILTLDPGLGDLRVWSGDGTGETNTAGLLSPNATDHYFLALTINGTGSTNGTLYRATNGGALVTTGNLEIKTNFAATSMKFGNDQFSEIAEDLDLENVVIFDAALSAAEIDNVRQQRLPARTANLNVWYPLFKATDVEVDYGGNGRNATKVGSGYTTVGLAGIPWRRGETEETFTSASSGPTQEPIAGDITGSTTLAGTLQGAGAFLGTAAGTGGATGTLSGAAAAEGTTAGTSTAGGTTTATGSLAGGTTGTTGAAGVVTATGTLGGTTTGSGAAAGTIGGAGILVGASPGVTTLGGALGGLVAITGTAGGAGTTTGALMGTGALSAGAGGATSVGATALAWGALAGTATGASTAQAAPEGAYPLVGSVAGTTVVSGALTASVLLSGTTAGVAGVSALLGGTGTIAGSTQGTGAAHGTLGGVGALFGTVHGTSTVTHRDPFALNGSLAGTSGVSGVLTGGFPLRGTVPGTTTVILAFDNGAPRVLLSVSGDGVDTQSGQSRGTLDGGPATAPMNRGLTAAVAQGGPTSAAMNRSGRTSA